jgi:predicted nucleotidyltransferase
VSALTVAYDIAVNATGRSGAQVLMNKTISWSYRAAAVEAKASGQPPLVLSLSPFADTRVAVSHADRLPTVANILVHGSQATADACDFSDVDILVILEDRRDFQRDEHVRTIRELRTLLASIYAFDPLMHHGLMLLAASELDAYDERFLPVEALQLSKVLFGPLSLRLNPGTADAARSRQRVQAAAASLRDQLLRREHLRGDYQLKNLVSGILLLPALFLAAHNTFVYKRRSFELARSHFSSAAWDFIAAAEQVRRDWVRPRDPWWKKAVAAIGHPRSRTLLSDVMPSRLNLAQPAQQSRLRELEGRANLFFTELEAAAS